MHLSSWALVAHACNPSYSGGRDQEIAVQSHAVQIVGKTLTQKSHHKKKKGLVEWLKV
jgi:hypothetical protein